MKKKWYKKECNGADLIVLNVGKECAAYIHTLSRNPFQMEKR